MEELLQKALRKNIEDKLKPTISQAIDDFFIPNEDIESIEMEMKDGLLLRMCVRIAGERICVP